MPTKIFWKDAKNRIAFDRLRKEKGSPGGNLILQRFKELPLSAQKDADGKSLFISASYIYSIIYGTPELITEKQYNTLMHILENMENVSRNKIDWKRDRRRNKFKELHARKGRPGSYTLFERYCALPAGLQRDEAAKPIFKNSAMIQSIMSDKISRVAELQYETLIALLENKPRHEKNIKSDARKVARDLTRTKKTVKSNMKNAGRSLTRSNKSEEQSKRPNNVVRSKVRHGKKL
jgi:hypothetical protein